MNIGIVDKVFCIYEFIIICGLVFRFFLKYENNIPSTKDEIILPLPDPNETYVNEPYKIEVNKDIVIPFKIPINKKEYLIFFNKVLNWCQKNVKLGSNRKIKPFIEVSFNKRGDILGYYQYTNKLIMVYVLKHNTIEDIVLTFIHEYVHHLQIRNTKDNIRYNSISKRKGYYSNDFEVEARYLSNLYLMDCCKHLKIERLR